MDDGELGMLMDCEEGSKRSWRLALGRSGS